MCILNPLLRTFRLFKHEIYFLFWGTVLACLDPDQEWDPLTQLNLDPGPKHWIFVKQNDTLYLLSYLFQLPVAEGTKSSNYSF
jgi:hypothetical protein